MAQLLVATTLIASMSTPALERPSDGGREYEPALTAQGWDGTVEYWRPLVEQHFYADDVTRALDIIRCESGGNPHADNPTSSAAGLFQHLQGWYSGDWGLTGTFDPYDPAQSIRAGAQLAYDTGSSWGNWTASAGCWR